MTKYLFRKIELGLNDKLPKKFVVEADDLDGAVQKALGTIDDKVSVAGYTMENDEDEQDNAVYVFTHAMMDTPFEYTIDILDEDEMYVSRDSLN